MTPALLTMLSMESPSTLLSMDTTVNEDRRATANRALDINLPLSGGEMGIFPSWPFKSHGVLDVSLATQSQDKQNLISFKGKSLARKEDSIWGAWFFFYHYFKPVFADEKGLRLDRFLVQHDMESMYMWMFKKRPENALGKMQLRSYMNGHARFGGPQFPFSVDKGFFRSHRMQRKHYRGLSNPQCIHGIEIVSNLDPSLIAEEDRKRWVDLTGRDLSFGARDFPMWWAQSCPDLEFDIAFSNGLAKKNQSPSFAGSTLNLSCNHFDGNNHIGGSFVSCMPLQRKKQKSYMASGIDEECCLPNGRHLGEILGQDVQQGDQPPWLADFSGVILNTSGPVTAAKSIYEDEKGYLIMVSLPFTDMNRVRVSWQNTATHGVVKVHCMSTARMPTITRGERTFTLTDPNPEHCPQGEFVREIFLATTIPENAELKAFYVEASAGLEIMVPKHTLFSEEREVRVFLPPQLKEK